MLKKLMVCSILALATAAESTSTAIVAYECSDWFVAYSDMGFHIMEWYGGTLPIENSYFSGNINTYGLQTITYRNGLTSQVWIDDFMLSSSSAARKIAQKCD